MLVIGLWVGFGERESAESCCEWSCVKATKGSSGLPKVFHHEQYFMGDLGGFCVGLGS